MGGQSRPQPMTMGMQQATNPIPADRFGQMMTPRPMTQAQSPYAVLQQSPAMGGTGGAAGTDPAGGPNAVMPSMAKPFAGPIGYQPQPYFGSGLFGGNSGGMPQGPQFPSMGGGFGPQINSMGGGMCGGGRQY